MAVRYSGDVEVRMSYDAHARTTRGSVTDGRMHYQGVVSTPGPPSSKTYDRIAALLIKRAMRFASRAGRTLPADVSKGGTVRLRRKFQAPCSL